MRFIRPDNSEYRSARFLTYDDVLLVPQRSSVRSRSDVDLSTTLGGSRGRPGVRLSVPVVSSNMDTVTGEAMVKAMGQAGGLGILHRFLPTAEQEAIVARVGAEGSFPFGFSIGVGAEARERLKRSVEACRDFKRLVACIDVAHGHLEQVLQLVEEARNAYPELVIIAGNVATGEGAVALAERGADIVKVGVGPGSMCTTRVVTGFGVPQLTAIGWAVDALEGRAAVIADGGIRASGDAVKALAAGAAAVMLGRYLAGAEEAPGQLFQLHQGKAKAFRGMASRAAQLDWKGGIPEALAAEGEDALVPVVGPVSMLLGSFCGGIRSGLAYGGAHSLDELRRRAVFIEISGATLAENHAHGKID